MDFSIRNFTGTATEQKLIDRYVKAQQDYNTMIQKTLANYKIVDKWMEKASDIWNRYGGDKYAIRSNPAVSKKMDEYTTKLHNAQFKSNELTLKASKAREKRDDIARKLTIYRRERGF